MSAFLDELLVGLGFDYDPADLGKFKKDLGDTTRAIRNIAAVAVGAATAITGLTIASTKASDEQGKLAEEIGENVSLIDALQFAATRAGGSADGMVSSLQNLNKTIGQASRGVGKGLEAFGMLGVDIYDVNGNLKSTSQVLLDVSQKIQGLERSAQRDILSSLGLSDSIRLLREGPQEIENLILKAKQLGTTSAEDAAIAAELQDGLTDFWTIIKDISRSISREFAPIITDLLKRFSDWWESNRQLINSKLPDWIDSLAKGLKILTIAVGAFLAMKLVMSMIALVSVIRGVTLSVLALNAAMFMLPIIIAALIAGFVLLAEDAKAFFEGGESFIGDMIKKYPEWNDQLLTIASVFATIADLTGKIFQGWSMIIDAFSGSTLDDFVTVLKNIPGFIGDLTGVYTVEGTGVIPDAIQKTREVGQGISDTFGNVSSTVSGGFRSSLDFIGGLANKLPFMESRSVNPDQINTNNTTNSRSVSVGKVEISVDGSSEPNKVAQEVYSIFQQSLQDLETPVDL